MLRIGLISDTHGLLRPEAERFLRGCDHMLRDASGVLMVNPGSAGPRRFKLPVTAAELLVEGEHAFQARLFHLLDAAWIG